jgi:hypothetical protein
MAVFEHINDREIYEHINDIYDNLVKYYLEELYDCQIDKGSSFLNNLLKYSKHTEKDKVMFYNYMYSDSYDKDSEDVKERNGKLYMNISPFEALSLFGGLLLSWPDVVKYVGKWYEENIHTYQGDKGGTDLNAMKNDFKHPEFEDIIDHVRDDCTGFINACVMFYICVMGVADELSEKSIEILKKWKDWGPNSFGWHTISNKADDVYTLMTELGFEEIKYKYEILQPFDIICGNKQSVSDFHHGEIYAGDDNGTPKSWSWGSVHDKEHGGMPAKFVKPNNNDTAYHTIWRLKGLGKITDKKMLGFEE